MSDVRKTSAAVDAMSENWPLIDALMGGTSAMRAAGKTYLPQWPNEDQDAYNARLKTATLFPAYSRTIEVLTGKPFARPLTITDDVPERIKGWCDDIDLQGRNLHAFAAALCEASLAKGIAGIVVDYPTTNGLKTVADERAAGVRPYFVMIHSSNILGWKTTRINGAEVFTQLRLLESVTEDDGKFGEKIVEQVRVLYPGKWETWRETEKVDENGEKIWKIDAKGLTTLKKVPFVPVYGKRLGFMNARPPMVELAHLNVEHWQSKSDQQTILHVARVPILFTKMLGDNPITVGAASAVKCGDKDGDMKYVEHSGLAIAAGRESIKDLEDQMRQIGAELLVIKPGGTSVAQTLSDTEVSSCALQRLVEDEEDAIDAALQLMAEWVGEKQGGHIQIFKDFGAANLAEATAQLLLDMNVAGALSDESLYEEMKRRSILRPDGTWEDEAKRIKDQPPKPGTTTLAA
ncbi:DUF4055 domain-containing protein [Robbsia andropogonis]|uniref:DUF4055 domain-containing protein n=1 Tax=Robbsia andropogonis TaxID=28092 RepID=UPI003D21C27E